MPRKPAMPCGVWFCPVPLRLLWPIKAIRVADIGAIYGRSKSEMDRRAVALGIWEDRAHPRVPVYSASEFRRMWLDASIPRREVGARLGMTVLQVYLHAKAMGLPRRRGGCKPSVVFGPLFAEMWRAGVLQRDMSRHFGCSLALIGIEADRQGLERRSRSGPRQSLTLAQFWEWRLGQMMAARVAAERQAA